MPHNGSLGDHDSGDHIRACHIKNAANEYVVNTHTLNLENVKQEGGNVAIDLAEYKVGAFTASADHKTVTVEYTKK